MTLNKRETLVFVPAFNEEQMIGEVLDSLKFADADILIVDDGSSDSTAQIVENKGVRMLTHSDNLGYESALSSGYRLACEENYKFAISYDADGQMNPEDVNSFINIAKNQDLDLVLGVRNYRNRLSEYLLSFYGDLRFNIKDPLCGLKLYRIESCIGLGPFDSHNLVGMEMAFKMCDNGFKYKELPVTIEKRKDQSRYGSFIRGEFNIIISLIRAIFIFGLYKKFKLPNT